MVRSLATLPSPSTNKSLHQLESLLSPSSTMHHPPDAFILLTLPDSSLTLGGRSENGVLNLECVTVPNPEATNKQQRDVYLVLRVNATEIPLDPTRIINRTDTPFFRSYTFARTESEPSEILLRVKVPSQGTGINPELTEKLDTFESILEQYAVEFRRPSTSGPIPYQNAPDVPPKTQSATFGVAKGEKDFRGHLVMVNEDTGEIIGEIQDNIQIHEDPAMYEVGHRNDPVIIEVPEETTRQSDANARQAFASLIPPDQQNWVTKSASMFRYACRFLSFVHFLNRACSQAISMTTNLLVTTITSATDYYVSHSSPSPHHSSNNVGGPAPVNGPIPTGSSGPRASGTPPPLPPRPRFLVFLTSDKTRKGMAAVHTVSGEAVKMSSRTLNAIDTMIRRAMGLKNRRTKYFAPQSGHVGPGAASLAAPPPPYETIEKSRTPSPQFRPEKGTPPRSTPSPFAGPSRSYPQAGPSTPDLSVALPHQPILTSKERILMSLDLILSTVDDSARKLLDTGPAAVGKIMAHK